MSTVVQYADLRPNVAAALRQLQQPNAGQRVIQAGQDACEVDWSPTARYHHTLELPLILLTTMLDEGAAKSRWSEVSFAKALSYAPKLDDIEQAILLRLAGSEGKPSFVGELIAWVDGFELAKDLMKVDRRVVGNERTGHYGVRPRPLETGDFATFKAADKTRQLAALAVMALYNGSDTLQKLKEKRLRRLDPPAVEGFSSLREQAGDEVFDRLLRMIGSYHGW